MLASCQEFAREVYETNRDEYARRGQSNPESVIPQIQTGKVTEWAVYRFFHSKGVPTTPPDMKIYLKGQKSYSTDHLVAGFPLHVKSQTLEQAIRLGKGTSWTCQIGGRSGGGKDKVLMNEKDKTQGIALCQIHRDRVTIMAMPLVQILHQSDCFKEPVLPRFTGEKKSIYYEDIRKLSPDFQWSFLNQIVRSLSCLSGLENATSLDQVTL